MRCLGPKRSNKYLAPDVKKVPITFLSDLMAQIELSCHISHLSLMYFARMEWYVNSLVDVTDHPFFGI